MKVFTFSSHMDHPGLSMLKKSLDKHGWGYEIAQDTRPDIWSSGMVVAYEFCKRNPDITHILYTDAWDTVALGGPKEVEKKYKDPESWLFSVEKACYPNDIARNGVDLAKAYPPAPSEWKYINCGGYIAPTKILIQVFEDIPFKSNEINIQDYMAMAFLSGKYNIKLDTGCEIFQTIAFEGRQDFTYDKQGGRLINNFFNSRPVFIHGNGRTNMDHVYPLV